MCHVMPPTLRRYSIQRAHSVPSDLIVPPQVQYSDSRLADAYELIGATFIDELHDIPTALSYWRQALCIRFRDPDQPVTKDRAEPNKVRSPGRESRGGTSSGSSGGGRVSIGVTGMGFPGGWVSRVRWS